MRWPIQKGLLNYYSNFQKDVFREVGVWWLGCRNWKAQRRFWAPYTCGNQWHQAATVGSNLYLPPCSSPSPHCQPIHDESSLFHLFSKSNPLFSVMLLSPRTSFPGYHPDPKLAMYSVGISIPITEPQLRDVIKLPKVITWAEPGRHTLWRPRTSAEFPELLHPLEAPPGGNTPHLWTHALIHIHINCSGTICFCLPPQQSPKQDRKPFPNVGLCSKPSTENRVCKALC